MKWWPGRDIPNLRAMGDRARDALKAYELAEAVYSEYRKERDALEVRYRSLIGCWWGEYEAGHLSPMDRYSVERELAAISTGIVELVQRACRKFLQLTSCSPSAGKLPLPCDGAADDSECYC